jgi:soluble lytic murein transglycosylase-like protein
MRQAVRAIFIAIAIHAGVPATAQDGAVARDFTFRKVGVPKPGTTNRITVQIDPEEQAAYLALGRDKKPAVRTATARAKPGGGPAAAGTGRFGWYWDLVPPERSEAGPVQLQTVLAALDAAPEGQGVPEPRLSDLQDITDVHGRDILLATVGTRVSPALALAVIWAESSGRVDARSSAGAVGLMQLISATAERFDVADSTLPADNIGGGVAYLNWLMEKFDNDPLLVIAAYNAGENAVIRSGGVPEFPETRDYVPKVLAAWRVARGLCITPPELMSDGCVFAVREARNDG